MLIISSRSLEFKSEIIPKILILTLKKKKKKKKKKKNSLKKKKNLRK